MNVLQINIRASQGGAGRICLDHHRRLERRGISARLLYGYGSGIADDPSVVNDKSIERTGTRLGVLANYAWHVVSGVDRFSPGINRLRSAVAWAHVIHIHAPHHYFINWDHLAAMIRESGKPAVITAHDWWFVTGRCANPGHCSGWQRACGVCGAKRWEDLPSLPDRSRTILGRRRASLRSLEHQVVFACPSLHLADDYRAALPWAKVEVVANGADLEFEHHVASQPERERRGILFSAADLSGSGKIDRWLVQELANGGRVEIKLAGRNNPFSLPNCTYFGEVRDRARMVEILNSSEALMFCSRMDNAPLTILEALVAGCYVVAFESAAASEMIGKVGGRCVRGREEALQVLRSGRFADLYGGLSRPELARRSADVFSGETMTDAYLGIYRHMLPHTTTLHAA